MLGRSQAIDELKAETGVQTYLPVEQPFVAVNSGSGQAGVPVQHAVTAKASALAFSLATGVCD